jgi:hypothetical protein
MAKRNRFHIVITVNRRFLGSGTIVAGELETDVSVNVDEDRKAQDACALVCLLTAHNLLTDDSDRIVIGSVITALTGSTPGPIAASKTTMEEAAAELLDDVSS